MQQTLTDTKIKIIPSEYLIKTILSLKNDELYLTHTLRNIQKKYGNMLDEQTRQQTLCTAQKYCTESDIKLIDQLKSQYQNIHIEAKQLFHLKFDQIESDVTLTVEDLKCLKEIFDKLNVKSEEKIYLNDIIGGCEICLPENHVIPRSPQLEERCQELRNRQKNLEYRAMTKNVDSLRAKLPEDTISYQLREINKQLIAVAQFVMSVLAGFAFGFIGIELIVGSLDFGFRLLLGIMCALIIALAEIYFLAKKLNEYSDFLDKNKEESKIDSTLYRKKINKSLTETKPHYD